MDRRGRFPNPASQPECLRSDRLRRPVRRDSSAAEDPQTDHSRATRTHRNRHSDSTPCGPRRAKYSVTGRAGRMSAGRSQGCRSGIRHWDRRGSVALPAGSDEADRRMTRSPSNPISPRSPESLKLRLAEVDQIFDQPRRRAQTEWCLVDIALERDSYSLGVFDLRGELTSWRTETAGVDPERRRSKSYRVYEGIVNHHRQALRHVRRCLIRGIFYLRK